MIVAIDRAGPPKAATAPPSSEPKVGDSSVDDASKYVMPPFPRWIGLELEQRSPERVTARALVTQDHANGAGILHGGAIMALADQCGGAAAGANLRPGEGTTTIESKTNFFAAVRVGDTLTLECTPLHRGRSTTVWQTVVKRGDGKRVAIVTQTQLTLAPHGGPG